MKIKLPLFLGLVVLLLPLSGFASATDTNTKNTVSFALKKAQGLRKQGDVNAAITLLAAQLKKHPQDLQVKLALAASYYQVGFP